MYPLETVLSQKMKDAEPALNLQGADRKLLQVACKDFINYLKFDLKFYEKSNDTCLETKIEQLHRDEPAEFEAFLTVWTGLWLKKWKQRVKLLVGNQNQPTSGKTSKALADGQILWTKLNCKQEMMGLLVSALVKNAEICGTEILAENILKMELGKNPDLDLNGKEEVFAVLNNSLRRAREMSLCCDPLIYVKVDKNYYAQ
jgi:hypothetical protein